VYNGLAHKGKGHYIIGGGKMKKILSPLEEKANTIIKSTDIKGNCTDDENHNHHCPYSADENGNLPCDNGMICDKCMF